MDLEEAEPASFVDYDQEHPAYYAARSLVDLDLERQETSLLPNRTGDSGA